MDYSGKTRKELLILCKEKNIKNVSSKTKSQIIAVLSGENNSKVSSSITPFLKWVGGKSQIIENVIELFPTSFNNYYEPFLGGGSVLLALLDAIKQERISIDGKIYASDLNAGLIGLWKNIQAFPIQVISETKKLISEYNLASDGEVYYYSTRTEFNKASLNKTSLSASCMFLFLNKTCFRGIYRENNSGKFNVPYGFYKSPKIMSDENILTISELIQDVEFSHADFSHSFMNIIHGDFIYLDPPYAPENETSFIKYNKNGFGLESHNQLFAACKLLSEKKIMLLMSNSEVDLVKNAFSEGYTTRTISCRRAINSKNPAARTNEILITNY